MVDPLIPTYPNTTENIGKIRILPLQEKMPHSKGNISGRKDQGYGRERQYARISKATCPYCNRKNQRES